MLQLLADRKRLRSAKHSHRFGDTSERAASGYYDLTAHMMINRDCFSFYSICVEEMWYLHLASGRCGSCRARRLADLMQRAYPRSVTQLQYGADRADGGG